MNAHADKIKCRIKEFVKSQGYVKYSVDENVFITDGGNYLGVLCEVNIKGEINEEEKESNLLFKIITPSQKMTLISLPEAYKKELFVYQELSQIFSQVQDKVKVPYEERYRFVKTYNESTEEIIILDNMRKKGYETNFRTDILAIDFAELSIKELAKYHALSFALEAKRPGYFKENIKTIKQPKQFNQDWMNHIQQVSQIVLNFLHGDRRKKFEDFMPTFIEKYKKFCNSKCGRDTLCHGDYRQSNILFKKVNEEIIDVIPIDYQLIYYGCPVIDLLYFIFLATDRNFRKNHLTYLKDLYHKTLEKFLEYFNLCVADVYPIEEFESQYNEKLEFGLMISVIMLPFLLAKDNLEMTRGEWAKLNFNVDVRFEERIVGVIDDFIEWGYL